MSIEKLRKIRLERAIPATILADTIGVEALGTYYKKEAGTLKFSLTEAKKLADFLELSIEELFFDEEIEKD